MTTTKTGTRRGAKPDPEIDVLAKIAEMSESDRLIAERLHAHFALTALTADGEARLGALITRAVS